MTDKHAAKTVINVDIPGEVITVDINDAIGKALGPILERIVRVVLDDADLTEVQKNSLLRRIQAAISGGE
jgi:hypothetical protein